MSDTIASRVQRGAAKLDEVKPGWADKIDLDTLWIGSCMDCILGQAFREDPNPLEAYGIGMNAVDGETEELGLFWSRSDSGYRNEIEDLTAAWKDLITKRRNGS